MAMPDLQRYPEKLCLIKYELEFHVCVWKLFIYICGVSAEVKLLELNTFLLRYLLRFWSDQGSTVSL